MPAIVTNHENALAQLSQSWARLRVDGRAPLLLVQRIDWVVQADFRRRRIDEMKVNLASGFHRLDAIAGKAERGGNLVRVDRFVL
jgi:hypothetical protein